MQIWRTTVVLVAAFGCGAEPAEPVVDAPVVLQSITINGQTSAARAVTTPAGIDCGLNATSCYHAFVEGSLVHLHIEQVDFTCGTMRFERYVADGSGSIDPVPYDADFHVHDMRITVQCSQP